LNQKCGHVSRSRELRLHPLRKMKYYILSSFQTIRRSNFLDI
jgi:hypothetical protein